MKNKNALFILGNDGITSYYAGIGTLVKSYLDTIKESTTIKEDYDLYLMTTYRAPEFFGYSKEVEEESHQLTKEFNGEVINIDDGLEGLEGYGGVTNWDLASENAAKEVIARSNKYDKIFVIAIDTSFMRIGEHLPDDKNIVLCISPQSLESIHKSGIEGRDVWEKERLDNLKGKTNCWISYSSYHLKEELENYYKVNKEQLIESMSGINLNSNRYQPISQRDINRALKEYDIPTDRDIVFTLGRLEKYKGFDQAIYFFNKAKSKLDNPYMVILGLSYFEDDPVVKQINKLLAKFEIDATFYTQKDMKLPLLLWQWHRTKYSLNLSKAEPFGMAPIEARYLSGISKGPLVVTSNNGGLAEQCENKVTGLKVQYDNIDEYRAIVEFVSSLSPAEYNKFRSNCAQHVTKCYDASKNITEHLKLLGIL